MEPIFRLSGMGTSLFSRFYLTHCTACIVMNCLLKSVEPVVCDQQLKKVGLKMCTVFVVGFLFKKILASICDPL